jgi:hypothetical protein
MIPWMVKSITEVRGFSCHPIKQKFLRNELSLGVMDFISEYLGKLGGWNVDKLYPRVKYVHKDKEAWFRQPGKPGFEIEWIAKWIRFLIPERIGNNTAYLVPQKTLAIEIHINHVTGLPYVDAIYGPYGYPAIGSGKTGKIMGAFETVQN